MTSRKNRASVDVDRPLPPNLCLHEGEKFGQLEAYLQQQIDSTDITSSVRTAWERIRTDLKSSFEQCQQLGIEEDLAGAVERLRVAGVDAPQADQFRKFFVGLITSQADYPRGLFRSRADKER